MQPVILSPVKVLFSSPLMQVDHYLFSAPGKPVFSDAASMAGMRLGMVQGYEVGLDFSVKDLWVAYASNSQALVAMLLGGRIDAMLLSLDEVRLMQRDPSAPQFGYDPDLMVARRYLGYCLLDNAHGQLLQKKINQAIFQAQTSGELLRRFPQLSPVADVQ